MSKHKLFRFKQFAMDHSRATMKIGTDGVLLGAWVNVAGAKSMLDIGTGSGVIALMLAQRSEPDAHIDAVELESVDAELARENVLRSPWPEKIDVYCEPVQTFSPTHRYDVIVTNPPYFINSFSPPDARRVQTRHTTTLTYAEIIESVDRLLNYDGRFSIILPVTEGIMFIRLANDHGLTCSRKWCFRTRREKPVERYIMEFCRGTAACEEGEILLYESGETWSESYRMLTGDFYLKT